MPMDDIPQLLRMRNNPRYQHRQCWRRAREKAAYKAAGPLVVGFSCEVETQSRDFAVAAGQELAHAQRNEGFINLDFYCFMLTCALDGEACFDVYNGELEKWPLLFEHLQWVSMVVKPTRVPGSPEGLKTG